MGPVALRYRLPPTGDSLKVLEPDRLRHSLCNIDITLARLFLKVKCFSVKEFPLYIIVFVHFSKGRKFGMKGVDKRFRLWFNVICIHEKDVDGKFAPFGSSREPAGGVSRC